MKLLICTQKVDKNDPILGFFHRWIEEFAKYCESITVICLQVGTHQLPSNVRVLSLGKEEKKSRFRYLTRFFRYIIRERKHYNTVLVHMNQEYVLLGGLFWKLMGKKILLWRNHYSGNIYTRIAMGFSNHIFCTSRYSFTAHSPKSVLMPVGIDTTVFSPNNSVSIEHNSILLFGRIAPSKRIETVIEALRIIVNERHIAVKVTIVGTVLSRDMAYATELKQLIAINGLNKYIRFLPAVPHEKIPELCRQHSVFVNASPSGMFDKTIFEAMACGMLLLVSSKDLQGQIDDRFIFREEDSKDLADKLVLLVGLSADHRKRDVLVLRGMVEKRHSITSLGEKIAQYF